MPRLKKSNYKLSNAAFARNFRHHSSSGLISEPSDTCANTLAATTPPTSPPPSTIHPADVPVLKSWDQPEGETGKFLPGPGHENVNLDDCSEDEGYGSNDCMSEMEGQELRDSLELQMEEEIGQIQDGEKNPTAYGEMMRGINAGQWKKAETNRRLGYNGLSRRKKQLDMQKARKAEEENKKSKSS